VQDICPGSDEVIIVTSSLMKDMNSKVELYRWVQYRQYMQHTQYRQHKQHM
jgi:hypothetical protein